MIISGHMMCHLFNVRKAHKICVRIKYKGSILMTRSWRISSMIDGPRLSQDGGLVISQNRIGTMRLKLMNLLSKLSQWGNFISSCGRHKGGTSSGIRKQITFADSIRVTMILMIPQIVLQIINVSVPSTRVHSVERDNGIYVCQSDTGMWLLVVGAVLAVLPFFLSLLLNVKSIGIPDQFREYEEISSSMISSIPILIITLPTANMIRGIIPMVYTYLTAASVLSFILPICYNISYTKMNSSVTMDDIKRQKPHSTSTSSSGEDDLELIKRAEDITTMASMFDTMGQTSKALDIDRDILSLFKKDKEKYTWEIGYTTSEISSLGPKSLEVVLSTLIQSSKRWDKIYLSDPAQSDSPRKLAIKVLGDASKVFDQSQFKHLLKDRRIVYQGYSLMNMLIKSQQTKFEPPHQTLEEFENEFVSDYLKETTFQQSHHCRALAMQADIHKRHGQYEEAIATVNTMRAFYIPKVHSKAIMKEYVSDHCADMISTSITWLYYLNRTEEAMAVSNYVINQILPEIAETELFSLLLLLVPVLRLLKDQGQEHATKVLKLLEKYIAEPLSKAGKEGYPSHPGGKFTSCPHLIS